MLRHADVFYGNAPAGDLAQTADGFAFTYEREFLKKKIQISAALPPRPETFISNELFPFFIGLLPEGWYLELVCLELKIELDDYFGLLLATAGSDTIGAVTVKEVTVR